METKKIKTALLIGCICIFFQLPAQRVWEERKGCVLAQGNLAPGYLFAQKSVAAYIDGNIEMFIDDRFSVTGAAWYSFATTQKDQAGLRANHAIFWGGNYHFLKPARFDPYISFTPGLGLVRASYMNGEDLKLSPFTIVPLAALSVGFNYYVGSIFHFFMQVQGVTGQTFGTLPTPMRLDEIKFMAGLAFNLRFWKPKKHDVWTNKKTG